VTDHAPSIPVSVSQKLFWTGTRLSPDSPMYNMAFRIDFHAALQPWPFADALDDVVRESDALRTVFRDADGAVTARVLSTGRYGHQVVDLTDAGDPEAAAAEWIEARMRRPFDLGDHTLDSALLRLGAARWTWFLNQHHIATDAWSASRIYRRVGAHYARRLGDGPGPAEPLPAYGAHVRAEQAALESPAHATARAHWRARLDSASGRLSLYGRPADGRQGASRRLRLPLGASRMNALEGLVARDDVRLLGADLTRFTVLATACAAYLARVSGARTIGFGATRHCRRAPRDRETVGLFVELFPLRARLDEGETFRSLYGKMTEEANALLFYGSPGASSPDTARRFNVILNYVNVDFGDFAGQPTRVEWVDPGAVDPGHALRFNVSDFSGRGETELALDVNTDRFDAALAERMPRHFLNVLDALLNDFDAPVDAVPLTDGPDASVLDHTEPVRERPADAPTVLDLFERQVASSPDAVALQQGEATVSYRELDRRSADLARRLRELRIGAGDIVGICARRSPELVVAVFGVLRSGAAFAPLEPGLPARRLALIVEDTGARVLVADETGAQVIAENDGVDCRVLEVPAGDAGGEDPSDPVAGPGATDASGGRDASIDPASPAYVYYTSGSTGRPKGVVVEHAGLADYVVWSRRTLCPDGPVDFPLFSAFGFDLTVDALFLPFTCGGRLLIYPEPRSGTDLSVRQVFADDAVDVVKLTPSHLALALGSAGRCRRIRTLLFSGEALTTELASRGQAALGEHVAFINQYGPTEAIVGCTWHRFDPATDRAPEVPIGVPARGASIYLLDEGMNPVPMHVQGEVFIGGERLARGYLGRPGLTTKRFLPDPFWPGDRMYRTGDHAVWDGERLHYRGRNDGQVKIHGHRIELGEIEHAIAGDAGIERCVVVPVRTAAGTPAGTSAGEDPGSSATRLRLAAYYAGPAAPAPEALRRRLAERLPAPMIPSVFLVLDELPVTSNGKIDRAALPSPERGWSAAAAAFRPPETATERTLARLWGEVLDAPRAGLDDNFFHLGGDSIAVIRLVDRARAAGLHLEVSDCFEQPSLAALARCADRRGPVGAEPEVGEARPRFGLSGLDASGLEKVSKLLGDSTDDDDPA